MNKRWARLISCQELYMYFTSTLQNVIFRKVLCSCLNIPRVVVFDGIVINDSWGASWVDSRMECCDTIPRFIKFKKTWFDWLLGSFDRLRHLFVLILTWDSLDSLLWILNTSYTTGRNRIWHFWNMENSKASQFWIVTWGFNRSSLAQKLGQDFVEPNVIVPIRINE